MEWTKIEGYDYDYRVNRKGEVVNFTRGNKMIPHDNGIGYLSVELKKGSKKVRRYIHRLVAEAFIPNPDGLPQVNHINQNKADNSVDNLEWCTAKENSHHSKSWVYATNSTSKEVWQFDGKTMVALGKYPSVSECARQLGISESQISRCCSGKFKQTHGFAFKYTEEGANAEIL